ncbi:MAG: sugar ABC transporter permease [Lachnospiraceae bacterium]|nr:sugar ABC transporter permease [Lachnospiraceae bacterium]
MKSRKKLFSKKAGKTAFIIAFLLPSILLMLVFLYYPAINGVIMSFRDVTLLDLDNKDFVGLENYKAFLDLSFGPSIWKNTFLWLVLCVGLEFVCGFGLSLLLQTKFPGKKIYESIVFVPWAISGFAVGVIWKWMFNGNSGVINDILVRLGILETPFGFLSNVNTAFYCVVVAKVWTGMAFFAIVTLAALKTVSKDMYEAAEIDGANGIQKFFYITLPSIRALLLLTILVRMISMMNAPDLIFGMTGGGPAGRSHTISSYILTQVISSSDYGEISAAGVILWLITLALSVIYVIATKATKGSDE